MDVVWMLLCALGVLIILVSLLLILILWNSFSPLRKTICIVVLGDIGRSPRMQYHALSFAKEGFQVDIVGYGGSLPHQDLRRNAAIKMHVMPEPPTVLNKFPRLLTYISKVLWQAVVLLGTFFKLQKSSYVLLQNPPAIPVMAVSWLVCLYRNSLLFIDWHNYGYTILGLALGEKHVLVRISKWYERFFGRLSVGNFCVTEAMKEDLANNWSIRATTMYDRAPAVFNQTKLDDRHVLFNSLASQYEVFSDGDSGNVFTEESSDGTIQRKSTSPVLLISSTSWTEDEDFSVLLNALQRYEDTKSSMKPDLPDIVCVITGKGPQKAYYQGVIAEKNLQHIKICTPWLTAEDYPKLLGSADLGVCLHKSSSGLDLPMKVVDMFGCGVPVCAIKFQCLHELVKHEENGMIFSNDIELASQLQELLSGFPRYCKKLELFRKNLSQFQSRRWDNEWWEKVLPYFRYDAER